MLSRRLGLLYKSHGASVSKRLGPSGRQTPHAIQSNFSNFDTHQQSPQTQSRRQSNGSRLSQQEQQRQQRMSRNNETLERATTALIKYTSPGSMSQDDWRQAKSMLDVWSKKNSLQDAKRAHQLLERLVEEASVNPHVKLTATMYNQCMNAFRKSGARDATKYVQLIFELMKARHDENPNQSPEPDTISYNTLLHTWAVSQDDQATTRAQELIETMETLYRNNPHGAVIPDTWSYNLVILAFANRIGEYGAAKAAEDWLLRLSELNIEDGARPDTYSFNLVLMAWANSQDEKGPDRAFEILQLLIKLHHQGHDVSPDVSSFVTVISSFAKRGNMEKAQKVLYLLREVDLPPRSDATPCFNAVIDAWAKSGAKDAGPMAETVLHNAKSFSTETNVICEPNVISYTSCLDAYAKSNHPKALENAEAYLKKIIESFRRGEWKMGPTSKTFLCIITAWARSDRPNRAQKAESWLHVMDDLANNEKFKCRPNAAAFNLCIDTWARSDAPNAKDRALSLLRKMEREYENGNRFARPIGFSYRIVIKKLLASGDKNDALEALFLVKQMEEQARRGNNDARPDTGTCNQIIYTLTQTNDEEAIKAALNLLRWMDQAAQDGLTIMRPESWTFTNVMGALSKLSNVDAKSAAIRLFDRMVELDSVKNSAVNLVPSAVSIALMTLPSTGDTKRAADKVLEILDGLSRIESEVDLLTRLDGLCLTTCLQTLIQEGSSDYALKAQELLKDSLQRFRDGDSSFIPTQIGFASVADALSEREDSVVLIEEILEMIEETPFEGSFYRGPGVRFYSKVINVLLMHGRLEAAEQVLQSWEEKCRLYEEVERPNTVVWNKLIRGWSKSSADDKAVRARGLLLQMVEASNKGGAEPDVTSYNTVLNAVSFAGSSNAAREEAMTIALSTYEELKSSANLQPDEVTYGSMLKAIDRMSRSTEKADLASSVFEECCASGHDGPFVTKEIGNILSVAEIDQIRNNSTNVA